MDDRQLFGRIYNTRNSSQRQYFVVATPHQQDRMYPSVLSRSQSSPGSLSSRGILCHHYRHQSSADKACKETYLPSNTTTTVHQHRVGQSFPGVTEGECGQAAAKPAHISHQRNAKEGKCTALEAASHAAPGSYGSDSSVNTTNSTGATATGDIVVAPWQWQDHLSPALNRGIMTYLEGLNSDLVLQQREKALKSYIGASEIMFALPQPEIDKGGTFLREALSWMVSRIQKILDEDEVSMSAYTKTREEVLRQQSRVASGTVISALHSARGSRGEWSKKDKTQERHAPLSSFQSTWLPLLTAGSVIQGVFRSDEEPVEEEMQGESAASAGLPLWSSVWNSGTSIVTTASKVLAAAVASDTGSTSSACEDKEHSEPCEICGMKTNTRGQEDKASGTGTHISTCVDSPGTAVLGQRQQVHSNKNEEHPRGTRARRHTSARMRPKGSQDPPGRPVTWESHPQLFRIGSLIQNGVAQVVEATWQRYDYLDSQGSLKYLDISGEDTLSSNYFKCEAMETKCTFVNYAPLVFRSFHRLLGVDSSDIGNSFEEGSTLFTLASPGRSGSYFFFSENGKYIIKRISQDEQVTLIGMLFGYYEHFRMYPHSLLVRIFALFTLKVPGSDMHFIVMENLFPNTSKVPVSEIYDLKGSLTGRMASEKEKSKQEMAVLKDVDFINRDRVLLLSRSTRALFFDQVTRDSEFLASYGIMDYSILLMTHKKWPSRKEPFYPYVGPDISLFRRTTPEGGVSSSFEDETPGDEVYFITIIDILTPYTWKKKLEALYKSSFVDKAENVSCIDPKRYSVRLCDFVYSHTVGSVPQE